MKLDRAGQAKSCPGQANLPLGHYVMDAYLSLRSPALQLMYPLAGQARQPRQANWRPIYILFIHFYFSPIGPCLACLGCPICVNLKPKSLCWQGFLATELEKKSVSNIVS